MSRKRGRYEPDLFQDYENVVLTFPLFIKSEGTITGRYRIDSYEEFYKETTVNYYKFYSNKKREIICINDARGERKVSLMFGILDYEDEHYESWLKVFKSKCVDITEDEYKEAFKTLIEEHGKFSESGVAVSVEEQKPEQPNYEDVPF